MPVAQNTFNSVSTGSNLLLHRFIALQGLSRLVGWLYEQRATKGATERATERATKWADLLSQWLVTEVVPVLPNTFNSVSTTSNLLLHQYIALQGLSRLVGWLYEQRATKGATERATKRATVKTLLDFLTCHRYVAPYHGGSTSSRQITEVKHRRAETVLGWGTAWEPSVRYTHCFPSKQCTLILFTAFFFARSV